MLSAEQRKKAVERVRRWRQRKKEREAAEAAAIARGETLPAPPPPRKLGPLAAERRRKAAERRLRRHQRMRALEAEAIARGEAFVAPQRACRATPQFDPGQEQPALLSTERRGKAAERNRRTRQRRKELEGAEEAAIANGETFERPKRRARNKAALFKPGSELATREVDRLRVAAERQRGYRENRKKLEAAQEEAMAKGEPFELPQRGQHLNAVGFKVGHEPAHKGYRARLSRDFILAFHQHFLDKGYGVFDELLKNDPATYARLLTSLVSKQVEVHADITSGFSDEYVLKLIDGLDRWLAAQSGEDAGALVLSALPEAASVS